ncbi:MAG: SAM-dependent methyltransferase, partial [Sideroxyarcus sp.]|nr:SAM-dependent methyltransferase [Sideroxyarcus sp.]
MLLTEYRLDLVVQALRTALKMAHPADAVLRHFFQEERIGSNERKLVAETLFGVLRHRLLLDHACTADGKGQATARRMALAYWMRFGGYNLRELQPLLRAQEAEWLRSVKAIRAEDLALPLQAELPQWIIDKMRLQHSDEEILTLGISMQQPAPLDLRVNSLLANRDEVLQSLQAEGFAATATPYSAYGIRLKDKPALNKHALFLTGKFEVQDEGSQLLGLLLAPKRNDMVVDFCAGAGGKTLMLGALMNSQGRLYAWDISEKRLTNLKPRLKRSG